ncbi:23S rRNA (uracil-5-)-methyltransferase RumA, partial [bacterium]|nr:23S rRNA (uracil-5-)-methyltransferase RumA [bacterium]
GVESSSSSSADAAHNAAANGILNYTATCADTDAIWPLPLRPDYAVVDPPRTGIPTKTLNELCHSTIPNLVYVSCNPTTFATDASHLSNQYELINVVPFDMFPNTIHMELIGVFRCRPF